MLFHKMKGRFFKGHFDIGLFLPLLIGLLYAGTGGWTAERWNGALAIMGLGAANKAGYENGYGKGYNTYNPELKRTYQTTSKKKDE